MAVWILDISTAECKRHAINSLNIYFWLHCTYKHVIDNIQHGTQKIIFFKERRARNTYFVFQSRYRKMSKGW